MDVVFALNQHGQTSPVANGDVVAWMLAMFPDVQPEDKWYNIPANLLPPDIDVAYVNFLAFMERHQAEFAPAPREARRGRPYVDLRTRGDTRPLITPQWREAHPDEWQRLWDERPEECPVCHERPDGVREVWDGPMNSDVPTRCTHWACVGCWQRIAGRDRRCPICRTSLRNWLSRRG